MVAAPTLAGCGGIAIIDVDGAGGAGSSSSTTTNASSSSGGPSALELVWVEALGSANCQPEIADDPLRLEIVIAADNSAGSANATISVEAARVVSVDGTTTYKTNPTDVIISAGSSQEVVFDKIADSAEGTNGCEYCGSTDLQGELDLLVDGAPLQLSGNINSMSCAF